MGTRSRAVAKKPAAAAAADPPPQHSPKATAHPPAPSAAAPLCPTTKVNGSNNMHPALPPAPGLPATAPLQHPTPPQQQLPPVAAPSTSAHHHHHHPLSPQASGPPAPPMAAPLPPYGGYTPSDISPTPDQQPTKKKRKKGQHHPQPAVPRDPVSAAVEQFARTYQGVPPDRAREALEATQQHAANLPQWLEAAVEWVARMQEIQDEADEMAKAMAASLQEDQMRKVAEGALWDQDPPSLLERFSQSYILRQVRADGDPAVLLQGVVKRALVELLEQERRCTCQWYPGEGSRAYFRQLGEELRGLLPATWQSLPPVQPAAGDAAAGSNGVNEQVGRQLGPEAATAAGAAGAASGSEQEGKEQAAAAAGEPAAAAAAAAAPPPAGPDAAQDAAAAPAAEGHTGPDAAGGGPSAEALQQLAELLTAKTATVVADVSKMPDTPGGLPTIFQLAGAAAAEAGDDDPDEVVVLEARSSTVQREVAEAVVVD